MGWRVHKMKEQVGGRQKSSAESESRIQVEGSLEDIMNREVWQKRGQEIQTEYIVSDRKLTPSGEVIIGE